MRWTLRNVAKEHQRISDKYSLRDYNEYMLNNWFHFSMKQDDLFNKYFKTRHPINKARDPLTLREFIFYAQCETEAWCEDNCSGKFYIYFDDDQYLYFIKESSDAALFKLTWM